MDDTGTTRIGKFVFNHPFFIPVLWVWFWLSASASCWAHHAVFPAGCLGALQFLLPTPL
jgi:anaerobic C4-dicarboxylate transporter